MFCYTGTFPYGAVRLDSESLRALFKNEPHDQILIFSQIDLEIV